MNNIFKLTLFAGVLAIAGCSSTGGYFSGESSSQAKVTIPDDEPLAIKKNENSEILKKLANIEEQSKKADKFSYLFNNEEFLTYISHQQPILIIAKIKDKETHYFYQSGKLIAVQTHKHIYLFDGQGKINEVVDQAGNKVDLKSEDLNNKQHYGKEGQNYYQRFSLNKTDKTAHSIKTGDVAKLNYLCISKIQQVAGTKRVFRKTPNQANNKTQQLKAEVRLNGKDFYNMDCKLNNNKITKLNLQAKN